MNTIYKTGKANTYFEGSFFLREKNYGFPINFPTVFTAFGKAIYSGNWQSCTAINTPQFVIDHYFDGDKSNLSNLWEAVFNLEKITWEDVTKDKDHVLKLISDANNELSKLNRL